MFKTKYILIFSIIILIAAASINAEDTVQNEFLPIAGWKQVVKGGLGDSKQELLGPLVEFQDHLYVGTYNKGGGCQIWRSPDGDVWENVIGPGAETASGFGNNHNEAINKFLVFGGWLYAGLWNEIDGAELWRSSDGINWEAVVGGDSSTHNGFGKLENSGITALGAFKNMLFAGTGSLYCKDGVELWSSRDYGVTWQAVAGERIALFTELARESKYFLDMEVFGDYLYIATGDQRRGGSEIWRSQNGFYWEAVVGAPSLYSAGMGNLNHDMIYDLYVFNGGLYAGVYSYAKEGGALWRSADGRIWEIIVGDGRALYPSGFGEQANFGLTSLGDFEGSLYLGTVNEQGAQLWQSFDGLKWQCIVGPNCLVSGRFGNINNRCFTGILSFKGDLYVATHNIKEGGELWRLSKEP